jgi:hypothetical protein
MTTSGSQADDEFIAPVTQGTMECLVALRYHSYNGIGQQCIADYLLAKISLSAEYERIFALKRRLGKQREFFDVARYMQCLATCAPPGSEGDE